MPKETNYGPKNKVSCIKQGSKMNGFCLKQGQVLKALEAYFSPDFPGVPPGFLCLFGSYSLPTKSQPSIGVSILSE